jgi:thiamine biosynthesis lipoprotein
VRSAPSALPLRLAAPALAIAVMALAGCRSEVSKSEHRWFGMDTDFSAILYTGSGSGAAQAGRKPAVPEDKAFALLEAESARLEKEFSDYLPGSSLRGLQGRAGDTLSAGPEILAVFRAAREMAEASHGAFDITLHNLKTAWGLSSGDAPRVPTDAEIAAAMRGNPAFGAPPDSDPSEHPPFTLLPDGRMLLLRDSAVFDLGGIAKGYAVDRMHAILDSLGYPDHILKAGGDMRLGGSKGREPWTLGIRHPRDKDAVAGALKLAGPSAISTSGDYERFFIRDGMRYHHVFNPRNGRPARPYCSVTVLAANSLLADRLTKPLFILGPKAGAELLKRFDAKAVWMRENGAPQSGGSPDDPPEAALCYVASAGLEGILSMRGVDPCP